MIRTVSISEITEYAFGDSSELKNHRTWWGRPLYDIDEIMERMTSEGLTKADRYPNGKICHLKALREFNQKDVEAAVLRGPKPKPTINIADALIENFQAVILVGSILVFCALYLWIHFKPKM